MVERSYIDPDSDVGQYIKSKCERQQTIARTFSSMYGKPETTARERKLVEICFQLVLTALDERAKLFFQDKTNEEKADWVRGQLRGCGFDVSDPVGASWGDLK